MTQTTRRGFITATAATAASYQRILGANDRVQLGFIGFGLIGKQHVSDFKKQKDADLVALCEVYKPRLEEGLAYIENPNAKGYSDFRKMYENKDIQGVVISTPDHWHALQTILACAAEKDVYVEKPLTVFVAEGRWMVKAARKYKRMVAVGTQRRHGTRVRETRELVASGKLGKIHSVRMGSVRNIVPGFGKTAISDPPSELDYDMWLGPAPRKQYTKHRSLYHFRWFWDYSGGQMTNLAAHHMDQMHYVMNVNAPTLVYSAGGRLALEDDDGETPDTQDAIFTYQGFTAIYSIREGNARRDANTSGVVLYGTNGTLSIGGEVFPESSGDPVNSIPRFLGHPAGGPVYSTARANPRMEPVKFGGAGEDTLAMNARDWLDSIKSRKPPFCEIEDGHRVATATHLANISLRVGRSVRWDPEKETIPGDNQAAAMLVRPYRKPWDGVLKSLDL
jgi:predicted dehydrogenase